MLLKFIVFCRQSHLLFFLCEFEQSFRLGIWSGFGSNVCCLGVIDGCIYSRSWRFLDGAQMSVSWLSDGLSFKLDDVLFSWFI